MRVQCLWRGQGSWDWTIGVELDHRDLPCSLVLDSRRDCIGRLLPFVARVLVSFL
jgi:hypothetical protein